MDPKEILYKFDLRLRDVVDKAYMDISTGKKVAMLNNAKDIVMSNVSQRRDKDERYKRWLRPIEVSMEELEYMDSDSRRSYFKYPKDWYNTSMVSIVASKGKCKDTFDAVPLTAISVVATLKSYWKANYVFRQCYREEDSDYIMIYHDGDFKINKSYISYLKRVYDMHCPTEAIGGKYRYSDGKIYNVNKPWNVGEGMENVFIEVAAILAGNSAQEVNVDIMKNNILNNINKLIV